MATERLNVVTAVSRPDNLAFIQRHLAERLPSFDVRWYCVADTNHVPDRPLRIQCEFWGESSTIDCAGGAQKNAALDQIGAGWVCFLDDDNTVHPRFDESLSMAIRSRPDCVGHVFGQVDGSGRVLREAAPQFVRNGRLDLGQFVLRRDVLSGVRFPINVYNSDWLFFEQVWREHADRIAFREPATFYNALADGQAGFTHDWFSHNRPLFEQYLGPLKGTPEVRGLEIGSFEGRSSCWLLENIVTEASSELVCIESFSGVPEFPRKPGEQLDAEGRLIGLEERFLRNVRPHQGRVRLLKQPSFEALRHLTAESFDFAYVDGSHRAPDVLEDFVCCFRLLKPGGLLIGDDYAWTLQPRELDRPGVAIDAFLRVYADRIEVLHSGYAVALRKTIGGKID